MRYEDEYETLDRLFIQNALHRLVLTETNQFYGLAYTYFVGYSSFWLLTLCVLFNFLIEESLLQILIKI